MANLKIFLSSTCYDLGVVRSQIRNFLITLGYDPILSEYSDVLFDPRSHNHTSCVQEVPNCDMVILIIGSRFGGVAVPEALESVEIDKLTEISNATNFADDGNFSVTQLEVLRAIQTGIPIFTFVDSGVLHDHLTYEKNKHKAILKDIEFPHIDKQETATYIFEFINFLRLRTENNSLIEFSKLEDIETHLKKQWSGLFQRLLYEQRNKQIEAQRIDYIANQIADIKTAIMTSISNNELKETAKGAIKYRMMIDFLYSLATQAGSANPYEILMSGKSWKDILSTFEIIDILAGESSNLIRRTVLLRSDNTYFRVRFSFPIINKIEMYWTQFQDLSEDVRKAILDAILDNSDVRPIHTLTYVNEQYESKSDKIPFEVKAIIDDDIPF